MTKKSTLKRQIVGYIIVANEGEFHLQFPNDPEVKFDKETLWFAGRVTLFGTRKKAQRAIQNTLAFRAKKYPYRPEAWPWFDRARIIAVDE